ncbi:Glutaredoxin [Scenedesmus sp. PABB004]|nr:Glutaredoxin [Scenedesmus sp. PABB004]
MHAQRPPRAASAVHRHAPTTRTGQTAAATRRRAGAAPPRSAAAAPPRAAERGGAMAAATPAAAPPVTVFTTSGCPYCRAAKEALRGAGVRYDVRRRAQLWPALALALRPAPGGSRRARRARAPQEVDVSGNAELRAALAAATGQRTVPQVFVNGALVGGSDALTAAIGDGRFQQLLAAPGGGQLPAELAAAVAAAAAAAAPAAGAAGAAPAAPALAPELQQLLDALAAPGSGLRRAPRPGSPTPAFSGAALLDWASARLGGAGAGADASAALLAANAVTLLSLTQPAPADVARVAPGAWYGLRAEASGAVPWGAPLNTHYWWGPAPARPAQQVAEGLRARILALYDRHLSADGRAVSYAGLRADPDFWSYVDATAELQRVRAAPRRAAPRRAAPCARAAPRARLTRRRRGARARAQVDLAPLSRAELMCFAINTYNALVVHALVVHGAQQYASAAGRLGFFQKVRPAALCVWGGGGACHAAAAATLLSRRPARAAAAPQAARYNIGGSEYVLDDLENGILRGNRPAASALGMLLRLPRLSSGPFKRGDPRAQHVRRRRPRRHAAAAAPHRRGRRAERAAPPPPPPAQVVSPLDARIHFALVCGAKSCPPIKLYAPDTLEEGLQAAAEAFVAADVEVDAAASKVVLSKIFSWYYPDFGDTKAQRLAFLLPFLPPAPAGALRAMLAADPGAGRIAVQHRAYDWDVNAAPGE